MGQPGMAQEGGPRRVGLHVFSGWGRILETGVGCRVAEAGASMSASSRPWIGQHVLEVSLPRKAVLSPWWNVTTTERGVAAAQVLVQLS